MSKHRRVVLALVLLSACKRRPLPTVADAGRALVDASASPGRVDASVADASVVDASVGPMYRSPSGGFSVRFPEGKAPEVEEKTITGGSAAVRLFKVQYGTSGYIVTYDDFAKTSTRTTAQILDGAREGVLETTGGTIDSERPLSLDGHPGLELAVAATTSGITMRQRVRVWIVDGRLYQLIVVAPTWSGALQVEQEFFDSFTLLSARSDAGPP